MSNKKISIIIANYNNGHFFKSSFQSLIHQTSEDWEAIIIDDKSTDNSKQIIHELVKEDARFKVYENEENIGYQQTLLKGIALSTTPLFARLDPDDALQPEAVEKSVSAHKNLPEVGLVYSDFTYCDKDLNPLRVNSGKQITKLDASYFNFNAEISHFASFKRSIYDLTTGIDPYIQRAEDKDIYMKMCEVAPVKHLAESMYLYRLHANSASSAQNNEKAYFWHWVALIKMGERTGRNLEDLFVDSFISKNKLTTELRAPLKSKWAKIGHSLGLYKAYKNLQNLIK